MIHKCFNCKLKSAFLLLLLNLFHTLSIDTFSNTVLCVYTLCMHTTKSIVHTTMHAPTPKLRGVLLLNGSQIDLCNHYASLVYKLHILPEQVTAATSLALKISLAD